jgi:hypothetical protein
MKIRAFNLVPGAVIYGPNEEPRVVHSVHRNVDNESVTLWFVGILRAAQFDFNEDLSLMGLTPHYDDWTHVETDFGTDAGDAYAKAQMAMHNPADDDEGVPFAKYTSDELWGQVQSDYEALGRDGVEMLLDEILSRNPQYFDRTVPAGSLEVGTKFRFADKREWYYTGSNQDYTVKEHFGGRTTFDTQTGQGSVPSEFLVRIVSTEV